MFDVGNALRSAYYDESKLYSLHPLGGIKIRRVCWFVCLFVR